MRYLDLSRVAIQDAMRVRPLSGGRALLESNLTPLIYALDEGGLRAIFIGFDLYRTDFPLRVAFPLFVSNALRWLSPSRLEDAGLQLRTGHDRQPAAGASEATFSDPAGRDPRSAPTRMVGPASWTSKSASTRSWQTLGAAFRPEPAG
jgi:hypothetical protein